MDFGGTGDVLDLRPLASGHVYLDAVDLDNTPTTPESLQVVTSPTSAVFVRGHFAEYSNYTSAYGQQGRIETLLFADGTVDGRGAVAAVASAASAGARSTGGPAATLAAAAPKLAAKARKDLADDAEGPLPPARRGETTDAKQGGTGRLSKTDPVTDETRGTGDRGTRGYEATDDDRRTGRTDDARSALRGNERRGGAPDADRRR